MIVPVNPRRFSGLVLAGTGLVFLVAAPLLRAHARELAAERGMLALVAAAVAGTALLGVLARVIDRQPAAAAVLAGLVAIPLVILSGNLIALAEACAILVPSFLLGDVVSRALRGRDPGPEDWAVTLAAGVAATGLVVLILAETHVFGRGSAAVVGLALVVLNRRRAAAWAGRARDIFGTSRHRPHEALWAAVGIAAIAVTGLKVLGPDVSWDALAYHLPEARDIAEHGRVAIVPDLFPQALLWHNYENFLGLGFLFPDGERVARFLDFLFGIAGFGASISLARRIGKGAPASLVVLALAGFPTILYQLHTATVDWPAAVLVVASATEFAASRDEPRRGWLGAAMFGAAVVTKHFAILAAPALVFLALRRGGWSVSRLAALLAFAFIPVVAWMGWSWRHFGSPLAPLEYFGAHVESLPGGRLVRTVERQPEPSPDLAPPRRPPPSIRGFLRLPYDMTFRSSRVGAYRDGYLGVLSLLIGIGVLAWRRVPVLLFAIAALTSLVAWEFFPEASIRYILPEYPLYAVFAVIGLSRGTNRFEGRVGAAAGIGLAAVVLAFPTQFALKKWEVETACGRLSRAAALESQLPVARLWRFVTPRDRAVLVGEFDRFHCPAGLAYRTRFLPVVRWGGDPNVWRRELRNLGITVVVYTPLAGGPAPLPRLTELERSGDLEVVARSGATTLYRVSYDPAAVRGSLDLAPPTRTFAF